MSNYSVGPLNPGVAENWKVLDSAFQKYSKGYEQLEAAFVAVQVLEADPQHEVNANEAFNFFEEATSDFSRAAEIRVREQRKSGEDGGGSVGAHKKVAKSVDSLKPDVLTKSMKPTEFRNWRRRFNDWHNTSCFDVLPVEGQTAFLRSVMEVEIIDQVDFEGVATIKAALDRVEAQFMLQECYHVLVSLKSWPGQLLSLNPCLRPKILTRMLFLGIVSLEVVILDITAYLIRDCDYW